MDTALKQRLIGAAVLVALAVFFLPMLVKGPAPDSGVSDVSLKIPDGPDGAMETRDLPLVAPGEVPKGGAVGMDATPIDRSGTPVSVTAPPATGADAAAAGDAITASPDGATAPTDPAGLPPAAAGGDYAVHFGAYATAKNADTVVALAKAAQLPAYSEPATVGGKAAWRVRIGPYSTRADAESARLKALAVRSDVPVRVVVLDAGSATPTAPEPSAIAPATTAPKPAVDKPAVERPAVEKPAVEKPAVEKPAVEKPVPAPVAGAKPAEAKPAAPKPAAPKPETKPLATPSSAAAPKPVAANPATPKPVASMPAAPNSAAATPAANPATPKPAAKPSETGAFVAVAPKPKPVAAAATAAKVGFAVQVGAFGDAAEATALRDRLRGAGFAAFTETVNTDKGRLTRVRVGPVVDRAAADQLKAQVQSKTGVEGIVRSHP